MLWTQACRCCKIYILIGLKPNVASILTEKKQTTWWLSLRETENKHTVWGWQKSVTSISSTQFLFLQLSFWVKDITVGKNNCLNHRQGEKYTQRRKTICYQICQIFPINAHIYIIILTHLFRFQKCPDLFYGAETMHNQTWWWGAFVINWRMVCCFMCSDWIITRLRTGLLWPHDHFAFWNSHSCFCFRRSACRQSEPLC